MPDITGECSPKTIVCRIVREGAMNACQFASTSPTAKNRTVMFRGAYSRFARMEQLGLIRKMEDRYAAPYQVTRLALAWLKAGFPMYRRMPKLDDLQVAPAAPETPPVQVKINRRNRVLRVRMLDRDTEARR